MARLTIEGRKVIVDDSFLTMSLDEQNAAVEEIAASIGVQPQGLSPQEIAQMEAAAPPEYQGQALNSDGSYTLQQEPGKLHQLQAGIEGALDGIPIVGGAMVEGARNAAAYGAAAITGGNVDTIKNKTQRLSQIANEAFPKTRMAGQAAGAIGSMIPLGSTALGAKALGMAGKTVGGRAAAATASGTAISAADTAARGGNVDETATSGAIGGAISGAVPFVGRGLSAAGSALSRNPQLSAASKKIKNALNVDQSVGGVLSESDTAFARANDLPIINADLGGQSTLALLKSAANTSPEARQVIKNSVDERFAGQHERLHKFITNVAPSTDAVGALEALKASARKANKPAYEKAFSKNFANGSDGELVSLLPRIPASAMRDAIAIGKMSGEGFRRQVVATIDDAANTVTFSQAPTLREWDLIRRGLKDTTDAAFSSKSGGKKAVGTAAKSLLDDVTTAMDKVSPDYKTARQGAAAAFGQEGALEAGRAFAKSSASPAKFKGALEKLKAKPSERKLFQTGYAEAIIEQASKVSENADVIGRTFNRPDQRAKFKAVFGAKKARKMEVMIRIESTMNMTRQAFQGGSPTAQYLNELTLAGGLGGVSGASAFYTGDWQTGIMAAITGATMGFAGGRARAARKKISDNVLKQVAQTLVSNDETKIAKLVSRASMEPQWMGAIDHIATRLAVPTGVAAGGQ